MGMDCRKTANFFELLFDTVRNMEQWQVTCWRKEYRQQMGKMWICLQYCDILLVKKRSDL